MNKAPKPRTVKINRNNPSWQLQQQFGKIATALDRLPDAAEVRRNPPRSAPVEIAGMVF